MRFDRYKVLLWGNLALVLVFVAGVVKWALLPAAPVAPSFAGRDPAVVQPDPERSFAPRDFPNIDYEELRHSGLFQTSAQVDNSEEPGREWQPVEEPDLRLRGTIAGPPQVARAIIESRESGAVGTYRIGDMIEGARIEGIQRNLVILVRRNEQYRLRLHSEPHTQASTTSTRATTETPVLKTVKDRSNLSPLEMLLAHARIEEYREEDRDLGLKITQIEDLPLASFIGLQEGDIIQTINGQFIPNRQKGFQVMQKVRTQSRIEIDLLRDGREKALEFEW